MLTSPLRLVTTNEDGTPRETTIWLAVVDGQGYIRTGHTHWEGNIERNPDVVLRIDNAEYPLRAEFVQDPDLKAWATKTLPTLSEHLRMAKDIHGQVEKKSK